MNKTSPIHPFIYLLLILLVFMSGLHAQNNSRDYLEKGWQALIVDNDIEALHHFSIAYETAKKYNDVRSTADALLNLGICSYGSSYHNGLKYAILAIEAYKKVESSQPIVAAEGQSRCLQLISTIYSRQGKYKEAIFLSKKAMEGLIKEDDSTGTWGLIYSSLGSNYAALHQPDSSEYYHILALDQYLQTKNYTYLPVAYIKLGNIALNKDERQISKLYYQRALAIADSTGNKQAQVSSLLAMGKWYDTFEKDIHQTENYYLKAKEIASGLSDKFFTIQTLQYFIRLKTQEADYKNAMEYAVEMQNIKDSIYSLEKEKIIESLEAQFKVLEQDKELEIARKNRRVFTLTNYLLWGSIVLVLIISIGVINFLKRINKRDKLLLQKKEELQQSLIQQQQLKDQQMQNELDFKESQLSALTLQMFQKNELMKELKDKLENIDIGPADNELNRIIHKGFNQDKEWDDFNIHFESINKNFYTRLRQSFPEISPNDLRICALIKLNLTTKEMAGILNISPDSVKTARYRLRKKLQLHTEDNLTAFIQSLS